MNHIPVPELYKSIDAELTEQGIPFHALHIDRMFDDVFYIAVKDDSIKNPHRAMWISLTVEPDRAIVIHVKRGLRNPRTLDFEYKVYKHPRYFKKYMHVVRIVHEVIKQKHKELNQHG